MPKYTGPSSPHFAPLVAPLVPRVVRPTPNPLPICDPARELRLEELVPPTPLLLVVVPPRRIPRPLVVRAPLVPAAPRPRPVVDAADVVPAIRALSCSSSLRRISSRRRSASLRSRCLASSRSIFSASISSRSLLAPFQFLLRMRRWLCSVCDRIRVHVFRRVDALVTVWETLCNSGWSAFSR